MSFVKPHCLLPSFSFRSLFPLELDEITKSNFCFLIGHRLFHKALWSILIHLLLYKFIVSTKCSSRSIFSVDIRSKHTRNALIWSLVPPHPLCYLGFAMQGLVAWISLPQIALFCGNCLISPSFFKSRRTGGMYHQMLWLVFWSMSCSCRVLKLSLKTQAKIFIYDHADQVERWIQSLYRNKVFSTASLFHLNFLSIWDQTSCADLEG